MTTPAAEDNGSVGPEIRETPEHAPSPKVPVGTGPGEHPDAGTPATDDATDPTTDAPVPDDPSGPADAGPADAAPDGAPETMLGEQAGPGPAEGRDEQTPDGASAVDLPATGVPEEPGALEGAAAPSVPWDLVDQPDLGTERSSTVPTPAPAVVDPVAGTEAPATVLPSTSPRPHGRHEASGQDPSTPTASPAPPGGWSKLGRAMRPQVTRSQLLAGLLCALLGFALAVQVSQTQEQQLSSLRQTDLVRLLDDVTQRANALETRVEGLQDTRDELSSGSDKQRAALELAQRQAETQGILSGRLPAEGPGITLTITETDQRIPAHKLFNILEELRNAGVEVVEVNGIRLVTSSYFEETSRGMVVDGQKIASPYQWKAIGDPSTLETALEIPGGAMSSVRNEGADPRITQEELLTISSTREPETPEFATPVPAEGGN